MENFTSDKISITAVKEFYSENCIYHTSIESQSKKTNFIQTNALNLQIKSSKLYPILSETPSIRKCLLKFLNSYLFVSIVA